MITDRASTMCLCIVLSHFYTSRLHMYHTNKHKPKTRIENANRKRESKTRIENANNKPQADGCYVHCSRWFLSSLTCSRYGFLAVCALDAVSHYARLYSSLTSGSGHKVVKANHFGILKIYYGNKYFLAFMCAGNEGFWLMLYLLNFVQHPIVYGVLCITQPLESHSPSLSLDHSSSFSSLTCVPRFLHPHLFRQTIH